ncbi:AAA family ATPase [Demequina sediminicola]|uniref:AAA family ATPase n=1 Tax=Demequina sediminicola TaxID=1095026 RepID=UPI0013792A89|nr:AAA family ATPase [Demequina sediminicola]
MTERPRARLKTRRAGDITARAVRWLWHQHIPQGEVVLVAGREGVGKSTFCYRTVAQITRGELTGEYIGQPRNVIIVATEDSWAHTIVPRLMAESADLDRVVQVEAVELTDDEGNPHEVPIMLPRDLVELEQLICDEHAAAVLLDPLMSRMGEGLDTHVDRDVRQALEPLTRIGHATGAAILGIIHQNKGGGGDVLNSIMGSRAFSAVARAVLVAMRDPMDEARRLVGIAKSNLGPDDLEAWAYTVEGVEVGTDPDDGREIIAARYVDHGRHDTSIREAEIRAHEVARQERRESTTPTGAAEKWLRELLDTAGEHGLLKSDVLKRAGELDYSEKMLRTARESLGVVTDRRGVFQGPMWWSKPEDGWKGAHAALSPWTAQEGKLGKYADCATDSAPALLSEADVSPQVQPKDALHAQLEHTPRARTRDNNPPHQSCSICSEPMTYDDGTGTHAGCEVRS